MSKVEQYEMLEHKERKILKAPTGEIITMNYPPRFFEKASRDFTLTTGEAVTVEGPKGLTEDEQWAKAIIESAI